MTTPICDFVQKYISENPLRLHMPGHKGRDIFGTPLTAAYPYDITEIKGADSLFEASGIIAESEKNAASLFHTAETVYSAGGSTLCIQAMLDMVCGAGGRVAAVRNCHRAFVNAAALLDLDVLWVYPEYEGGSILSGRVTAEMTENAILSGEKPNCFYMTSPDYLGKIYDVRGIAEVCHKHGVPLIVDNAHGAHLAFLSENIHPIALGADLCCDSGHKMLPVLTGGAYLHIGNPKFAGMAKAAMSRYGSTSPSYLILQSLDMCNKYLSEGGIKEIRSAANMLNCLKKELSAVYRIEETEPLRMTVSALECGLYGHQLADILRESGIECEYADETHVVLLFSPVYGKTEIDRLKRAMKSVRMPRILLQAPKYEGYAPKKAMGIRQAAFAPSEKISVDDAEGKICSGVRTACPPGVAVIVSGEVIDKETIKILKRYSIFDINVVK